MKNLFTTILVLAAFTCFSQIPDGYYDNAEGLTGDELKTALNDIIDNHTEFDYGDLRYILDETDQDPNDSNNLILLYKGNSISSVWDAGATWNREHVWAKSHGDFGNTPPAGTDLHHIRPADPSVNSSRGNKDFDNGGTQHHEATECYYTSNTWEPRDAVKGDVARMMFYMATRYEGESGDPDLELVDCTGTYTDAKDPIFGKLSTLIEWNEEDPVDDFERNRNEVVYSYQGNRNPFVDHPEYVNAIYVEEATAIALFRDQENIKIYPNPVSNVLNITAPDNYSLEIYSIIGEKILSTKEKQIGIQHLNAGIYFVVIKNENGTSVKSKKIIKK